MLTPLGISATRARAVVPSTRHIAAVTGAFGDRCARTQIPAASPTMATSQHRKRREQALRRRAGGRTRCRVTFSNATRLWVSVEHVEIACQSFLHFSHVREPPAAREDSLKGRAETWVATVLARMPSNAPTSVCVQPYPWTRTAHTRCRAASASSAGASEGSNSGMRLVRSSGAHQARRRSRRLRV